MTLTTRFAPSPTGPLHLGHAFSACLAHDIARAHGGRFLLRIEDIDQTRARPEWVTQIRQDLAWLGLTWDKPPIYQSQRIDRYQSVLEQFWRAGFLYVCTCKRRDILAALDAPQEGQPPAIGPDGLVYPGTCRATVRDTTAPCPTGETLRLDMQAVLNRLGQHHFDFVETSDGGTRISWTSNQILEQVGDIVLSRRDFPGSYHLSVVLDDADQGVTHVIRGNDLRDATVIHILLQRLLGLQQPVYHHHDLVRDDAGKRLAKRDDARAIAVFRDEGYTPEDVRRLVGLQPGSPSLIGAINSVSISPITDV